MIQIFASVLCFINNVTAAISLHFYSQPVLMSAKLIFHNLRWDIENGCPRCGVLSHLRLCLLSMRNKRVFALINHQLTKIITIYLRLHIWNFSIIINQHIADESFILKILGTFVWKDFSVLRVLTKFFISCHFLRIVGCFLRWIRKFSSSLGCYYVSFIKCVLASLRHLISSNSLTQIVI